jgi:NTP pyrophosphatase (non-canonical NTP hydrolase)
MMTITDYLEFVQKTDRLPRDDLSAVLHGLFGEVGGIMAAAKKLKREPGTYTGFNKVVIEEFGDAFWYLCCLADRLNVEIADVLLELTKQTNTKPKIIVGAGKSNFSLSYEPEINGTFDNALVELGQLTGTCLSTEYILEDSGKKVYSFLKVFFNVMGLFQVDFGQVLTVNIDKVSSRFIRPDNAELPTFDEEFPEFERLPNEFEIEFVQRTESQQAIRLNGVFIGAPLTDSIKDIDGYRFHDVFHFSNAAILHWSPTFRALLKHKRKSKPGIDEAQDGGRAIVVEEGLTAWIFTIAGENDFFAHSNGLTFDMLKNIGQFVKGYEVEKCPLILWEEAILKGYEVFREIVKNNGGVVIGNRNSRTIEYRKS